MVFFDCCSFEVWVVFFGFEVVGLIVLVMDIGVKYEYLIGGYGECWVFCEVGVVVLGVEMFCEIGVDELDCVSCFFDDVMFWWVWYVVIEN